MDQIGYVVSLSEEYAIVDVRRTSACGDKCGSCKGGCHVPAVRVKIKNRLNAKPGDYVEISMETKSIMKSAFVAYIIPLFMLIIGIGIGVYFSKYLGINNSELFGLGLGVIFLTISFFILKIIDNRVKEKNSLEFTMENILY